MRESVGQMKIKSAEEYTKTVSGSVQRQFKKCGKSNCRCARGELHGAYYYHFVRVGGKLIRRYLKAGEVEQTRQACLVRRSQTKAERINSNKAWQQLREIRESLRSVEDFYNR
jgi:hypothetical protein